MMTDWLHPALLFVVGALILPLLKGRLLQAWLLLIPLLAIADVASMSTGEFGGFELLETTVSELDALLVGFQGRL